MLCPKCGAEIQKANARFCENCGAVISRRASGRKPKKPAVSSAPAADPVISDGVKTYVLRCKSCGGTLNPTEDEDVYICPYCGSKELVEESDAVKIEKMKTERQKILAQSRARNNEQAQRKGVRERIFIVFAVFLLFISLVGCLMGFVTGARASGIVSVIQVALLTLALIACRKAARPKLQRFKKAFLIIAAILIIPYLSLLSYESSGPPSSRTFEPLSWEDLSLSSVLPDPGTETGHLYSDSTERLSCDIVPYDLTQFKAYVKACKEAGFTVDIESANERDFSAYNEEGYHLELYLYSTGDYMSLSLEAPIEMSEFIWPTHGLAVLLPTPSSGIGRIEGDSKDYFSAYVGETTKAEYSQYVTAVMDAGFDIDYYRNDSSFGAENADGVRVNIYFEGNKTMSVRIFDYN